MNDERKAEIRAAVKERFDYDGYEKQVEFEEKQLQIKASAPDYHRPTLEDLVWLKGFLDATQISLESDSEYGRYPEDGSDPSPVILIIAEL